MYFPNFELHSFKGIVRITELDHSAGNVILSSGRISSMSRASSSYMPFSAAARKYNDLNHASLASPTPAAVMILGMRAVRRPKHSANELLKPPLCLQDLGGCCNSSSCTETYAAQARQPLGSTFWLKNMFPWVASRAHLMYLAARTHNRAAVCLPSAHIATWREFWIDWLRKRRSYDKPSILGQAAAAFAKVSSITGLAPAQLFLGGHSAGGHLSLMLALRWSSYASGWARRFVGQTKFRG